MLAPWKESYDQPRQHIKKLRDYLSDKDPKSQRYSFSSRHVWRLELNHKESRAPKDRCFEPNCGTGDDCGESLGLQGEQTSQY